MSPSACLSEWELWRVRVKRTRPVVDHFLVSCLLGLVTCIQGTPSGNVWACLSLVPLYLCPTRTLEEVKGGQPSIAVPHARWASQTPTPGGWPWALQTTLICFQVLFFHSEAYQLHFELGELAKGHSGSGLGGRPCSCSAKGQAQSLQG